MKITDYGDLNPATPSQQSTPEQVALARKYVEREASDLVGMLFGLEGEYS